MLNRACEILEVKPDELNGFSEEDSFNNNNKIEGFICRRSDHRYGALIIFKINGEDTEQIIYGTPKLHYPFDKAGVYKWPPVEKFKFYEKLDGTNILAYRYLYKGEECVTFKTRLTAVVKDSGFSAFKSMWIEYLSNNSWVNELIAMNKFWNLSFELFGSRNPITITYDFPLDVNLLFGVNESDFRIRTPDQLNLPKGVKVPSSHTLFQETDLTKIYNFFREEMSGKNKDVLTIEGLVMYADIGLNSWELFKCKPEEIERIHWSASGHIPERSLFNTALNTYESYDDPTIDNFLELLKEEYPPELLTKNTVKINRIWGEANERVKFVKQVNDVYKIAIEKGFDVKKDKNETMRFVSQYFPKSIMNKVGGAILKQAGLLKDRK